LKDKLLFIPLWFLRNVAFRLSCETLIINLRNFYAGKTGCYTVDDGTGRTKLLTWGRHIFVLNLRIFQPESASNPLSFAPRLNL